MQKAQRWAGLQDDILLLTYPDIALENKTPVNKVLMLSRLLSESHFQQSGIIKCQT